MEEARRRHYEVDRTPRPLVAALVGALVSELDLHGLVRDFLDPSAGDGRFGEVVRELFPELRASVAIEPRIEERRQLRQVHTHVVSSGFDEWEPGEQAFDLIATNPPFRRAFGGGTWLPRLHTLLRPRGVLALYAKTSLGQSQRMARIFRTYEPILALRVVGRVDHRGNGRTDQHDVTMWAWSPDRRRHRRGWHTMNVEVGDG
jgi:hypothetical protein